jgi:hypothetical protein
MPNTSISCKEHFLFFILIDVLPFNVRQDMWYQLDGALAYYTRPVRDWLNHNYPGRWIGLGGPVTCTLSRFHRLDIFMVLYERKCLCHWSWGLRRSAPYSNSCRRHYRATQAVHWCQKLFDAAARCVCSQREVTLSICSDEELWMKSPFYTIQNVWRSNVKTERS